jgi:hypothetical protein
MSLWFRCKGRLYCEPPEFEAEMTRVTLTGACCAGALVLFAAAAAHAAAPAAAPPRPAAPARPAAPVRLMPVDLELVLAADTSSSIDQREAVLQRRGVAEAFRSPALVNAIRSGSLGKIAVAYLDWSGEFNNRIVVNWQVISDAASAERFAATLLKSGLTYGNGTSIGGAIAMAYGMIETNDLQGARRTIDISGDGPNNFGRPVSEVRDEIVAKGITINGLPIATDDVGNGDWGEYYPDIIAYYKNCVIGGRGSFFLPAKGFQDFAAAVRRKLVLEISDATPPERGPDGIIRIAAAPARPAPAPARPTLPAPQRKNANCITYDFSGNF